MDRIVAALLSMLALAACSRLDVVPSTGDNANLAGVRFYRPQLYVLITATVDKDGKLTGANNVQIIPLPNLTQGYILHPFYGLGTLEFQPTLTDGWNLTALAGKQDSKIPELITALGSLATAVTPKAREGGGAAQLPPLAQGLYRISFDSSGYVNGFIPVSFDTRPAK